jgi:tryptophan-rich sensory protein
MNNFNQTTVKSLLLNISVALILVLAMNGIIFSLGWQNDRVNTLKTSWVQVPGYLIGIIWIILFGFMATARWYLNFTERKNYYQNIVVFLIFICLIYPLYTTGLQNLYVGIAGIIVTAIFAMFVIWKLWNVSRRSAYYIIPVIVWLFFAATLTISQVI